MNAASMHAEPFEVVMASAGTGKTFNLTNRMAGLLARGVPVERILAATFTRKAAGEIRERLLSRVARAAADEAAAAELSRRAAVDLDRRGWLEVLRRLSRGIHRVRIGTLDSLAQSLARSLAPELGLAAPWRMAMDHAADQLRQDVVERVLADLSDEHERELLRTLAGAEASARADAKLTDLLRDAGSSLRRAEADAWACLVQEAAIGPDDAEVELAASRLRSIPGPINKSGRPDKRFVKAAEAISEDVKERNWPALLSRVLISGCEGPAPTFSTVDVPADWLAELRVIFRGAIRATLHDLHRRNLAAGTLITRALKIDDAVRKEQRAYTLEDLWRALAEADLDTQHVAYRLDAQFDHVLLDEFQDTSIDQWRVLEPLIDEAVAGGDRSRTVFVVGDVKQSLYGWRNAQADLLPHVAKRWPQMHRDTLKQTYRCAPEIIDAVNLLFGSLTTNPSLADHAVAVGKFAGEFEEHASAVPAGAMVRVVDVESQLGDEFDDNDVARHVAQRVASVHAQRPEADIAVLVRRQKPIGRIITALASQGIRAIADAASTPCDHPVVEAVLSALQLAEHPGDGPALYAVANSPLGAALECTRWNDRAGAATLSRRISGWVFEEGIARTVERLCALAEMHTNARGRQRLADLVAQAEAYASEPPRWAGIDDFIGFARSARVRPHGSGLVRVLTLHGAKGLQFDAVFLADLDGRLAKRPPAVLIDADGLEDEHPTSPPSRLSLSGTTAIRKHSRVLSEMCARWQSRSVYEELCLLYVGMTRAKRHLELLVRPSAKGLGAAAWNGLGAQSPVHEIGGTSWLDGSVMSSPQPAPRAVPPWAQPGGTSEAWAVGREPWRVAVVQPSKLGASRSVASLLATSARAADLGSEVHRLLECVAWLEESGEDPASWSTVVHDSTGKAVERIRKALAHGSLRGVLSRDAIVRRWGDGYALTVHREMPLSVPMDVDGRPALVRGRIDRLVLGRKAGRVERCLITDFKTGAIGESAPGQIELYKRAIAQALGVNPDLIEAELVSLSS